MAAGVEECPVPYPGRMPPTLADALRSFTDDDLLELFASRSDLTALLPQSLSQLAARSSTKVSVRRALDGLHRPDLQLLQTLAVLEPPVTLEAAARALGCTAGEVGPVMEGLRVRALVIKGANGFRPIRTVLELLPEKSGLAPGVVQAAQRGQRIVADFCPQPPPLPDATAERFPGGRAAQAAQHALEMTSLVAGIARWDGLPGVLRRGGVAQRDHRRFAADAGAAPEVWSTAMHAAWSLGLLAHDGEDWQATAELAAHLEADDADQWALLVDAWLSSSHIPSLAGEPVDPSPTGSGSRAGGPRAALSDETRRAGARERRRLLLQHIAAQARERDVRASTDAVMHLAAWLFPLVPAPGVQQEARFALAEAEAWGLLADGVPTALLESVLSGERAAEALRALLPPQVDQVILDSDLTITVPGRPTAAVQRLLEWAESDGRGPAATGRFTPSSIAAALRTGTSADHMLHALRDRAITPVPQALEFLITDEARKVGRIEVRSAQSVLTGEEAHLDRLFASDEASMLGLVRLAPTAALATVRPALAADLARCAGMVATGDTDASAPHPRSARRASAPAAGRPAVPAAMLISAGEGTQGPTDPSLRLEPAEAVRRIRAAEENPSASRHGVSDRIRAAIADGGELRLGIVDGRGGIVEKRARPLTLEAGRLTARDAADGTEFTVLVHRVTLG